MCLSPDEPDTNSLVVVYNDLNQAAQQNFKQTSSPAHLVQRRAVLWKRGREILVVQKICPGWDGSNLCEVDGVVRSHVAQS